MSPQERIRHLQSRRHQLLELRTRRDVTLRSVDMELNVVRTELLALYAAARLQGNEGTARA